MPVFGLNCGRPSNDWSGIPFWAQYCRSAPRFSSSERFSWAKNTMCCSSEIPAVPTENVGVTVVLGPRVTVQVPLPVQVPDHPEKVVPVEGTAVNTTLAPLVKSAVQVPGQSIPAGLLVTVPEPLPVLSTVSAIWVGAGFAVNVALTLSAAFIETVHVVALPLQAPVQSVNLEPVVGASVSLTDVPSLNFALHVLP